MTGRCRQRGFTLLELAVSVIVVSVILGLLLQRFQLYQQEAEPIAVRQLVGTLRTALGVRNVQLIVAKKEHLLRSIIGENPMNWLVHPPSNYLGEYHALEGKALPDGYWYYDRGDKSLVYRSKHRKTLLSDRPILLRFKVEFSKSTLQSGKSSGSPSVIEGAVLDEVDDHGAAQ